MGFAITLASFLLDYLCAITRIADDLAALVSGLDAPRQLVFLAIVVLFLGVFMDALAMIVIAVPISVPIAEALGFCTIWF